MKLSMTLNYSGDPAQTAQTAKDYEAAGVDMVWVAELYSFDAVSLMGYLAAVTDTMEICAGILPIYSRTPTLIGMTAAGIDALSGGRCVLGLGASGPQVIEGWHGVPYSAPDRSDQGDHRDLPPGVAPGEGGVRGQVLPTTASR